MGDEIKDEWVKQGFLPSFIAFRKLKIENVYNSASKTSVKTTSSCILTSLPTQKKTSDNDLYFNVFIFFTYKLK